MNQTLYRKYRPQFFKDLIGQDYLKTTLQNEILTNKLAHAYLFTGPRGIGKTSLARIMAKSLNCLHRKENEFEPCNRCTSCREITNGQSLDLIEIDAATNTQVDKVRENIIENIKFVPHNKYKIFIIDEVHMLSTAAFNALLKTLEEPPAYAVFILCTTESHKLPETIISRCQQFNFTKVSAEKIVGKLKKIAKLEKIKVTTDVLQTIALRSGGFIRDAESLFGQIISLFSEAKKEITSDDVSMILPKSDMQAIHNLVASLLNKDTGAGIEIINNLVNAGVDLERFNLDLVDYLRKIILIKANLADKDENISALPEEIKTKIISQAEKINFNFLIKILETFLAKQTQIKNGEISQLPLEIAVVEICENILDKTTVNDQKPTKPPATEKNQPNTKLKSNQLTEQKKLTQETATQTTQSTKEKVASPPDNFASTAESTNDFKKNSQPTAREKIGEKIIEINLEDIKNKWPEILKQSQTVNHSMPLLLESAYPHQIKNNILELGFEFEIHANKLKDEKSLIILENLLEQILKQKIKVLPKILAKEKIENLKRKFKPQPTEFDDQKINSIAEAFGGKIVE